MEKSGSRAIGTVILSDIDYKNGNAEVHIKLIKDCQGKGYGTDIVKAIVKYSFEELRLHCIYSHINEYNVASKAMFEKCGFEKDGIIRDRIFKKGRYHNVFLYSILNKCEV